MRSKIVSLLYSLWAMVRCLPGDRRGVTAVITALGATALIGFTGLGIDVASWQVTLRRMQGAVDQAVFAAAIASTAGDTLTNVTTDAKAVTASHGYVDGQSGVTVAVNQPPSQGSHTSDSSALEVIIRRSAGLLGVTLTDEGAAELSTRSRGTPRIANRLLRRVRDYAEVRADGVVTREIARTALEIYEVDEHGLDRLDRGVLDALVRRFGGGPVGLSTLAVALGEEAETVEVVAEPFLVRCGLLARTPRGRIATPAAWQHLGTQHPTGAGAPPSLFDPTESADDDTDGRMSSDSSD